MGTGTRRYSSSETGLVFAKPEGQECEAAFDLNALLLSEKEHKKSVIVLMTLFLV